MHSLGFRTRLFGVLSLFALVPALALTLAWGAVAARALPLFSGSAAWDRVANSGQRVVEALQRAPLTDAQRSLVRAHERELEESVTQARRFRFLAIRLVPVVIATAVIMLAMLWVAASRVAGHLSRQMSRPLDELVGWTRHIARGEPLPAATARGAPEFATLRDRMRAMASELAVGRERALEAERLRAYRETAQRVAHEIKNPLTPIQFAIARLRRDDVASQRETLEVLETETRRLEALARSFSQFGRLPTGPAADVDLAELARYTAQVSVPPGVRLTVEAEPGLPMVRGHHDALQRALSNVILNAVDACDGAGSVAVTVRRRTDHGCDAVCVSVADSGRGIPADVLPTIWEPYVTHKAGGTGLGLAIARQAVLAHHGTVDATSTPGEGTTITFTFPLAPHSPTPPPEAA